MDLFSFGGGCLSLLRFDGALGAQDGGRAAQCHLGQVAAVLVTLDQPAQLVEGPPGSGLKGPAHDALRGLVARAGLLVGHCESLLVWAVHDSDALFMYQSIVTEGIQVGQVIGLLAEGFANVTPLNQEGVVVTDDHPRKVSRHRELVIFSIIS